MNSSRMTARTAADFSTVACRPSLRPLSRHASGLWDHSSSGALAPIIACDNAVSETSLSRNFRRTIIATPSVMRNVFGLVESTGRWHLWTGGIGRNVRTGFRSVTTVDVSGNDVDKNAE